MNHTHDKHEHKHEECSCGHDHSHEHHHHDHEGCSCGHDHSHEHHHHDHEGCSCGHDHSHEHHHHDHEGCSCGHEHSHEHHHHDHEGCSCGHDHSHEHHHHDHEGCCCGHDHGHDHHHEHIHSDAEEKLAQVNKNVKQKVYIVENLGCANCAAKMERKINELPEVEAATLTFATKLLRIASNHQENLLPVLQEICSSIESQVVVRPREEKREAQNETQKEKNKKEFLQIGAGAVLFVLGILLEGKLEILSTTAFVAAYLILGSRILLDAGRNLTKGHVFDENFLMSIATIAAFIIGDFAEAVGVMLFFRVGELFEDIAVERSRNQIMEAVDMRPEVVNLIHGREIEVIPAGEAKVGDVVLVRPGDRIPLDGVVVHGESRIDTAPVTGEPVPIKVTEGDNVISGCVNTSGAIHIRVEKALEDSMVTRILNSVENAAASKPKIDRFITRFARVYTPVVVALALGTAIVPSLITGEWKFWIYTAITFLVISCPCALVLSVPLAFFSGIGAGSKQSILFKGGLALETLKDVKAVVMDKTGTITKGNFEVQQCISNSEYTDMQILAMAASCEMDSTHPIGYSIVMAAKKHFLDMERPEFVEEISGKGIHAQIKAGEVLCGNKELMELFHVAVDAHEEKMYDTEVLVALNGKYIGYLVIADAVKAESAKAIAELKKRGLKTVMLTGDTDQCAKRIAQETGVETYYAKLLPEDKLEKLKEIRKQHGAVMFVGDGINDAPVLAGADVGAAMGSGADAAIEAADVVFMTSSMEAIPEAISLAKNVNRIAMQNVIFALAIKALVMILGFFGKANMWMAVFADSGVAMICVLNSIRILRRK